MSLIDRDRLRSPLSTGILSLESSSPVSLGQRQLVVGDHGSGKTSVLSYIGINNVLCSNSYLLNTGHLFFFYTFIGTPRREYVYNKSIHFISNKLFNFFMDGTGSNNVNVQFNSPYNTIKICESFSYNGVNSVQILDSLDNHARLYRSLMLDLKRAPGREAFPGDIFYIHSSLLERFGGFSCYYNFGSITSLPVVKTQRGSVTDYITTNLISITDGQWLLSNDLRLRGLYPSVDFKLSLSRIGSVSQTALLRTLFSGLNGILVEYFYLLDLKKSSSLSINNSSKLFRYGKSYLLYYINKPLSYLSMSYLLMYSLFSKGYSFCSYYSSVNYYIMSSYFCKISSLNTLLYWGIFSGSSSYVSSILGLFINKVYSRCL